MTPALAALLLAMAIPAVPIDDVAAIREARAAYNAAIIAHDTDGVRAAFVDSYVGIAGSGGEVISGGDAMAAFFARSFLNPQFIAYVRTPDVVSVAVGAERAMERGHWLGRFRSAGGETRLSGEYLAVWVPTSAGWRLRSESFVTLAREEVPLTK